MTLRYSQIVSLMRFSVVSVMIGLIIATECGGAEKQVVFRDLSLQGGFRLSAMKSSDIPVEQGTILALNEVIMPEWRLAQWGTCCNLKEGTLEQLPGGTRRISNAAKSVSIFPGGLPGEGVMLTVHGRVEYGDRLRSYGQPWPHLLVEQPQLSARIADFEGLRFGVEFNVLMCHPSTDKALQPDLHTAHVNAFWTIHNLNESSKDFRDMIWFGIPLFDARYAVPPGHQAVDVGQPDATGKFICTIPGERFFSSPVNVAEWHTVSCNLLPLIEEALVAAKAHQFLLFTDLQDLVLTSFNLGWEVPGPYDCAVHIRKLALEGTPIAKQETPAEIASE